MLVAVLDLNSGNVYTWYTHWPRGYAMVSKVQKWGNSQGLRFPKEMLKKASIVVGDEVDIIARKGEIVVRPTQRTHGKYKLKDLVSRMPANQRSVEEDWGIPYGRETW
jgi:antitoxin MazE